MSRLPDRVSDYFVGVAAKRLSAVEADTSASNQHEFNGDAGLRALLGENKRKIKSTFLYLNDHEDEAVQSEGFLTWYDAREAHPTRSEYRLYFSTTEVSRLALPDDRLVICLRPDGTALVVIAGKGTTAESQLLWLFSLQQQKQLGFEATALRDAPELGVSGQLVLENLGFESGNDEPEILEALLSAFGESFPSTAEFSAFARGVVNRDDATTDPDEALMAWVSTEEKYFRTLEKHIVARRLREGFGVADTIDVDGFISYSLSVQNRRKSRAGYSLENHLQHVFEVNSLSFARHARTENNAQPDFLFPGQGSYDDRGFPAGRLTMLGVKTSCKDRWRQILSEAERIPNKHLFTLEPAISISQTREMQANGVQLVIPSELHATFQDNQKGQLMTLHNFIADTKERQC